MINPMFKSIETALELTGKVVVEVECEACKGFGKVHNCDAAGCSSVEHNGRGRYDVECEDCHRSGRVERTFEVLESIPISILPESVIISMKSILRHKITRALSGETVEGVEEREGENRRKVYYKVFLEPPTANYPLCWMPLIVYYTLLSNGELYPSFESSHNCNDRNVLIEIGKRNILKLMLEPVYVENAHRFGGQQVLEDLPAPVEGVEEPK